MKTHYLSKSIESVLRLIFSCLINGMVYEEADRLFFAMDYISDSLIDKRVYREVTRFKSLSSNLPNGFTIGGLIPLRKTTLLSVYN